MRSFLATLLLMLFAQQVQAQADDMGDFKRVLYRFLIEQRVFLNCSALDPAQHSLVVGSFEDMTNATLDLLRTYGTSDYVAEFQERTKVDTILMREARFRDVISLCTKNKDWPDRFTQLKFIVLQNEASGIFYDRHHPDERSK